MTKSKPLHILFLEDDKNMSDFVGEALTEAGFTYDWYENPKIMIRYLMEKSTMGYDAIVSDWNMPGKKGLLSMNGDALLSTVRYGKFEKERFKSHIAKNIPFVMCSAYTEQSKIDKIIKSGANFYQIKGYQYSLQPMVDYLKTL
jgi:CheY-like chemotaxis protein